MKTTGIDWNDIRSELDREDWGPVMGDSDRLERQVCIGTYPSDVEVCPACDDGWEPGDEGDDGICQDCYLDLLEEEASAHGLFVTSGEGDSCDILVGEVMDRAE